MVSAPSFTILLPARNEAGTIADVIDELRKHLKFENGSKILVIDNGSTDHTAHLAKCKGVEVVSIPVKGKGNAIRGAIQTIDTPLCLMMNSDRTYPATGAVSLLRILTLTDYDVVCGYRVLKEKGSMPLLHSLGNWGLSLAASVIYRRRIQDLCTGMWGFRTSSLKQMYLTSTHFTLEAELFAETCNLGLAFFGFPIGYRARPEGSHSHLQISDGFKILKCLIQKRGKKQ